MCHERIDWSRTASRVSESEDEWEIEYGSEVEDEPEIEAERETEDESEEEPIPADD